MRLHSAASHTTMRADEPESTRDDAERLPTNRAVDLRVKTLRHRLVLGVAASLLLHCVGYVALRWVGALPDVGFQLELPTQVEFGLADTPALPAAAQPALAALAGTATAQPANDGISLPKPPEPKPKAKKKAPSPAPQPDAGAAEPSADAGPDAHVPHVVDAGAPSLAATTPTASSDAGSQPPASAHDAGTPALAAYAPAGAQLALRIDMERVRASPLAQDARDLLDAMPDFTALLAGSGVQPVDDLARLFVASPDLERSSLVMAGSYHGDEQLPRKAVAALARASGKPARWRKVLGIAVAPWANADVTERVLALIGPSLFAITRPEDLPRVLAVAHALALRDRKAGVAPSENAAAALLAMEEGEALALSVENAKSFVRGPQAERIPERVRISIRLQDDGSVEVISSGIYASQALAEQARLFWQDLRDQFARHPLVALVGLGGPLHDTSLETHDSQLLSRTMLGVEQVRMLLGFVRGALGPAHGRDVLGPPTNGRSATRP